MVAQLAHVGLRSREPDRTAEFYERVMGLTVHERRPEGVIVLGWGLGHHVLELSEGAPALDHVALEVSDRGALEALRDRAEAAGAVQRPVPSERDAEFALVDPDDNHIHILGRVDRSGEHSGRMGHRPIRVQHVTFASADLGAMVDFYVDILGFRVSDRMSDVFTWMRCDVEHHTVAVVAADTAGLDHYSFDVEAWEALKVWCDQLAAKDVPVTWGPGRHGPGNNLFVMFDDPDGNRVELSAEMERYWEDRAVAEPRMWDVHPRTTNLWGPNPTWRSAAG